MVNRELPEGKKQETKVEVVTIEQMVCSSREVETPERIYTLRRRELRKKHRCTAAQNARQALEYECSGYNSWKPARVCETTVEVGTTFSTRWHCERLYRAITARLGIASGINIYQTSVALT